MMEHYVIKLRPMPFDCARGDTYSSQLCNVTASHPAVQELYLYHNQYTDQHSVATQPIYVLGTGLSHDGSACILKDGKIAVGIEKERLTRQKHDGGNDTAAVRYCLDALGIGIADLSLVVQCANFEKDIAPDRYQGTRLFPADFPVVTLSHHLAHAWSAVAGSPFRESNVLVIDGAGSPADQCTDWPDEAVRDHWLSLAQTGFYCEKDSFYHFDGQQLHCLYKDFSENRLYEQPAGSIRMPTNYHSIGGVYAAASHYCFSNLDDAGKLMGLAPYGRDTYTGQAIFRLEEGIVTVQHDAFLALQQPSNGYEMFKSNFRHYADVARWVQKEAEKAVLYTARSRMALHPHDNLCYAGGVALNAVANARLLKEGIVKNLYMQPAAGDNGLSIGCAFYGWSQLLNREIPEEKPRTVFFGKQYSREEVRTMLKAHPQQDRFSWTQAPDFVAQAAALLASGKVIAWYQGGAEFGPRALGHRSILADPRRKDIQQHINAHIKFREDFRPFAPAVPAEEAQHYFVQGWESPYMILVDAIREEWKGVVPGIVHVDGSCRVQTVTGSDHPLFHELLKRFKEETGIAVLVNTSFNRRGMPIVETPVEALDFFLSCALDVLVLEDTIVTKK